MGYLVAAEIDSIEDMIEIMKKRRASITLGEPMWYIDIEKYFIINKSSSSKIRERRPRDQNERIELDWIITTPLEDGFHYEKQPITREFADQLLVLHDVKKEIQKKTFEYPGFITFTFQEIGDKKYMLLNSFSELQDITSLKEEFKENFDITKLVTDFV